MLPGEIRAVIGTSGAGKSSLLNVVTGVYRPYVGGGIEGWIAYAAALAFLLVRPHSLFGQRPVERI